MSERGGYRLGKSPRISIDFVEPFNISSLLATPDFCTRRHPVSVAVLPSLTRYAERAATGRAVCKDKVCKENGVKIQKGELRVGIWVTIHEHGGYQWKHW